MKDKKTLVVALSWRVIRNARNSFRVMFTENDYIYIQSKAEQAWIVCQ